MQNHLDGSLTATNQAPRDDLSDRPITIVELVDTEPIDIGSLILLDGQPS